MFRGSKVMDWQAVSWSGEACSLLIPWHMKQIKYLWLILLLYAVHWNFQYKVQRDFNVNRGDHHHWFLHFNHYGVLLCGHCVQQQCKIWFFWSVGRLSNIFHAACDASLILFKQFTSSNASNIIKLLFITDFINRRGRYLTQSSATHSAALICLCFTFALFYSDIFPCQSSFTISQKIHTMSLQPSLFQLQTAAKSAHLQ